VKSIDCHTTDTAKNLLLHTLFNASWNEGRSITENDTKNNISVRPKLFTIENMLQGLDGDFRLVSISHVSKICFGANI